MLSIFLEPAVLLGICVALVAAVWVYVRAAKSRNDDFDGAA